MDEGVSRQRRRRFQFIAEVFSELSRVTWPTREEAIRLTLLVLSVAVIVGIFVGLWDFGLGRLASRFLF
jgi:preprotein translocase subunit SecE